MQPRRPGPAFPPAIGYGGFGPLGAGFGTVMVAATHVVVGQADAGSAGVAGGLQQTALDVGPALGAAVAGTPLGSETLAPLLALAFLALLGVAFARPLPGASSIASVTPHADGRDRSALPARR